MSENIPSRPVERLWELFKDKDYRRGFAASHVGGFLAAQIYSMRARVGWSQKLLASKIGARQPQISVWETSCENVNLSTLHKIAEAFDVALLVKFVPFSEVARESILAVPDRAVPSFEEDSPRAMPTHSTFVSISTNSAPRIPQWTGSSSRRLFEARQSGQNHIYPKDTARA